MLYNADLTAQRIMFSRILDASEERMQPLVEKIGDSDLYLMTHDAILMHLLELYPIMLTGGIWTLSSVSEMISKADPWKKIFYIYAYALVHYDTPTKRQAFYRLSAGRDRAQLMLDNESDFEELVLVYLGGLI